MDTVRKQVQLKKRRYAEKRKEREKEIGSRGSDEKEDKNDLQVKQGMIDEGFRGRTKCSRILVTRQIKCSANKPKSTKCPHSVLVLETPLTLVLMSHLQCQ